MRTRHLRCQATVHTPSTPGLWPRVPLATTPHWRLNHPCGPAGPSEPKETHPKCCRTEDENGMWAEKAKDAVPSGLRQGWLQRSSRKHQFQNARPKTVTRPFRWLLLLSRHGAAGSEQYSVSPQWWPQQTPSNPPFRSRGRDDAETGLEPAWPRFPQGLSGVLDAGRPTAALTLALRRWGGGFGLIPHFQRLS